MSSKDPQGIAWLDTETTGSELQGNALLEIGVVLTDLDLNEIDSRNYVTTALTPNSLWRMDPVVLEMHTKNGLLAECRGSDALSLNAIDSALTVWMLNIFGSGHVPYAGSGVAHFDRKFLERDLPLFTRRLTYWPLDVGVIRRTLKHIVGFDPGARDNTEAKPHRALEDARLHLAEMRDYRDLLREALNARDHLQSEAA